MPHLSSTLSRDIESRTIPKGIDCLFKKMLNCQLALPVSRLTHYASKQRFNATPLLHQFLPSFGSHSHLFLPSNDREHIVLCSSLNHMVSYFTELAHAKKSVASCMFQIVATTFSPGTSTANASIHLVPFYTLPSPSYLLIAIHFPCIHPGSGAIPKKISN